MPTKVINLQDNFLNQLRKDGAIVTIHLVNGFQIKGKIKAFDNFELLIEKDVDDRLALDKTLKVLKILKFIKLYQRSI